MKKFLILILFGFFNVAICVEGKSSKYPKESQYKSEYTISRYIEESWKCFKNGYNCNKLSNILDKIIDELEKSNLEKKLSYQEFSSLVQASMNFASRFVSIPNKYAPNKIELFSKKISLEKFERMIIYKLKILVNCFNLVHDKERMDFYNLVNDSILSEEIKKRFLSLLKTDRPATTLCVKKESFNEMVLQYTKEASECLKEGCDCNVLSYFLDKIINKFKVSNFTEQLPNETFKELLKVSMDFAIKYVSTKGKIGRLFSSSNKISLKKFEKIIIDKLELLTDYFINPKSLQTYVKEYNFNPNQQKIKDRFISLFSKENETIEFDFDGFTILQKDEGFDDKKNKATIRDNDGTVNIETRSSN